MTDQVDRTHNNGPATTADGEQLLSYVSRIEQIEEEIKDLNNSKGDIYKEAKAVGFNKKVIRMIVRRRAMDPSQLQEEEALLELYEITLGEVKAERAKKEKDPFDY